MGREKKQPPADEGAPAWMVTFADLMTLLLTFFVLLLAMSSMDTKKVKQALGSLRGALGVLDGGGQPADGRKELTQMKKLAQGDMGLMTTLERVVKKQNDQNASNDFIQIGHKDEAVFITIDDSLLFPPGGTEVLPVAYPFLDDLSAAIRGSKATVEFIGHSDDTTPSGYYDSNWEVAAARSLAVLSYVQVAGDVPGFRLKQSSHGEYQPRDGNGTPSGRARNRRVEILFTITSGSDRYFYGEDRQLSDPPNSSGSKDE